MIRSAAAAAALLLGSAQGSSHLEEGDAAANVQVVVRQQVIIRVPRDPAHPAASSAAVAWRESDGPRCVDAGRIEAASARQTSVDFHMRDNRHVRAMLGRNCAALAFYRGFYISPDPDGRICAERDSIRSRMGGSCEIVEFRSLRPVRR